MRKLIWSGTALVLLAVTGMFVAAHHAARNPDSFLGRCALTLYQFCSPTTTLTCCNDSPAEVAEPVECVPAPVLRLPLPIVDPIEPIMVEPSELEPPLGRPVLPPEVVAALQRLREAEESELPPDTQPFDAGSHTLRMPYADEDDVEVFPLPARLDSAAGCGLAFRCCKNSDSGLSGCLTGCGLFFVPSACWETAFGKVMEIIAKLNATSEASEESSDDSDPDKVEANELQRIQDHHHHRMSCPYSGGYSHPQYRYMLPRDPVAPARDR